MLADNSNTWPSKPYGARCSSHSAYHIAPPGEIVFSRNIPMFWVETVKNCVEDANFSARERKGRVAGGISSRYKSVLIGRLDSRRWMEARCATIGECPKATNLLSPFSPALHSFSIVFPPLECHAPETDAALFTERYIVKREWNEAVRCCRFEFEIRARTTRSGRSPAGGCQAHTENWRFVAHYIILFTKPDTIYK